MMPAEGMGPHADAKQRVELSKEGVGPVGEPKPKVSLFGFFFPNNIFIIFYILMTYKQSNILNTT